MIKRPLVSTSKSSVDGCLVVQIDTDPERDGEPEIRIYLNDECLYENPKFPASEDAPGRKIPKW